MTWQQTPHASPTTAARALAGYSLPAEASARLISLSENGTFLVETGEPVFVLRLYRGGYQDETSIRSELAWIEDLRRNHVITTPAVVSDVHGDTLYITTDDAGDRQACALFEFVPGTAPNDDVMDTYALVGATAARLHNHVEQWEPPVWFSRFRWGLEDILGLAPRWGRWQDGIDLDDAGLQLLTRAENRVKAGLAEYPMTPANSGLIHCDLRAANLLETDTGTISVIDFDDCGFSWFLWDLCSTITLIENKSNIQEIVDRWLAGYQTVRALENADLAAVPHLVVLRRLHLLAWLGSHPESDLAREIGAQYTVDTYAIATDYLNNSFLTV